MKAQELKDLHTKAAAELITMLQAAQKSLMTLKLDHEQNKLQNTSELANTRKNIAILQTILNMKQTRTNKVKAEALVEEKAKAKADKGGKE